MPTAVRVLHGERRPSRLGNPPEPQAGDPVCPSWLSDDGRSVFGELLSDLPPNVATRTANEVLGVLAESLSMLGRLTTITGASPPLLKSSHPERTEVVSNPSWRLWRLQADLCRRLLAEVGLTPAARAAMRHGFEPAYDERESLLSAPVY
jgi:hypothetical protein